MLGVEFCIDALLDDIFSMVISRSMSKKHPIYSVFHQDATWERFERCIIKSYVLRGSKRLEKRFLNGAYLTSDNCSTNQFLAHVFSLHFVGGASHRVNLAISIIIQMSRSFLSKTRCTMLYLRGLELRIKLHKISNLLPVISKFTPFPSIKEIIYQYI